MDSRDYFRRDQNDQVTPPDLCKVCSYAEHIVKARGKRTQYSSVSLDRDKIADFGPALYKLKRIELSEAGHHLVEHEELISTLRETARSSVKEERARALQAQRYALKRKEGLVHWHFQVAGVERKDILNWAGQQIQIFFSKV